MAKASHYDMILCSTCLCEDDCLLKGKHHFSKKKLMRMSSNDPPPDYISLHLHLNLLARLLSPCPRSHGDVVCVIKNILPPLAIHLLLSISSCWIWLDWCWVLHVATWCFTCLLSCVFLHSAWRRVWAARRQCCCCVLFVGLCPYTCAIKSPDLAE